MPQGEWYEEIDLKPPEEMTSEGVEVSNDLWMFIETQVKKGPITFRSVEMKDGDGRIWVQDPLPGMEETDGNNG